MMNLLFNSIIVFAVLLCIIIAILSAWSIKKERFSYLKASVISFTSIALIAGSTVVALILIQDSTLLTFGESLFLIVFFAILGLIGGYGHAKDRAYVQSKLNRKK
jgi:hypothetical protein